MWAGRRRPPERQLRARKARCPADPARRRSGRKTARSTEALINSAGAHRRRGRQSWNQTHPSFLIFVASADKGTRFSRGKTAPGVVLLVDGRQPIFLVCLPSRRLSSAKNSEGLADRPSPVRKCVCPCQLTLTIEYDAGAFCATGSAKVGKKTPLTKAGRWEIGSFYADGQKPCRVHARRRGAAFIQ